MRWKFKLNNAPRKQLRYYFLNSSFDPSETNNIHNIEETVLYSGKQPRFDSQLSLELTIGERGTATPKFTYYSGSASEPPTAHTGKSFFLDMTSTESVSVAKAYLGLDFGTSNTSVSYVSNERIQVYERRSQEESWTGLADLASTMPYPLAAPLAAYLQQTDSARLANSARDFIESALTLAAYVTYLELCSSGKRSQTYLLKGMGKRSAGPIWRLLQDATRALGKGAVIARDFSALQDPVFFAEIDNAVNQIAAQKHGKADEEAVHSLRPVQILANVCHSVFSKHLFGVFHNVHKKRFGSLYEGMFRCAHGTPPFIDSSTYSGTIPFSDHETFLVVKDSGIVLSLEPLILWHHCPKHPDLEDGHCYLFDCFAKDGSATYKAVGATCIFRASHTDEETKTLFEQLLSYSQQDPTLSRFEISLSQRTD